MPEKGQKQLSLIESLRAKYPNRNICAVAVTQLDNPTEMSQFLIQYAQEIGKTSERPETKANPFDTAVELIDRMASLHGGEIAGRWYELFATGTVQNVPDHSLDWLIPPSRTERRFEEAKKIRQNEPSIKGETQREDSGMPQIKPRSAGASYIPRE